MSIPIKDLSAGDTISSMVDKINYNFDLLALKGGGPSGIQGIQGIRGSIGDPGSQGIAGQRGSRFYDFDPDTHPATGYGTGDITLWGGKFYIIKNDGSSNYWDVALDINVYAESPFTNTPLQTTVLRRSCYENQIVLGISNDSADDTVNTAIRQRRDEHIGSALIISGKHFEDTNIGYHISLYGKNAADGNYSTFSDGNIYIDYEEGSTSPIFKFEGKSDGATRISCDGGQYIQIDNGNITLSKRTTLPQSQGNTAIVTTDGNGNVNEEYAWRIETSSKALFPHIDSAYDLGKDANRISEVFLKKGSTIHFKSDNTGFLNFKTKDTGQEKIVMGLSQFGVSFGINGNSASEHFESQNSHFGITVGNNASTSKAPHITVVTHSTERTNVLSESIALNNDLVDVLTTLPNMSGAIEFREIATAGKYLDKEYMPLIQAKNKSTMHEKCIGNTLCISGAKFSSQTVGSGKDVIITGGTANNRIRNMESVGGTVFISGGIPMQLTAMNSNEDVISDFRMSGNVIIGINPLHHKSVQEQDSYAADKEYDNLTSTNPKNVAFFDTNNVAIHGNRIVIDSNANYRKGAYGNFSNTNNNDYPCVSTPYFSTLQMSGINTVKHNTPVRIDASQCCEHQLLSGTMTQIFRIKYENDEFVVNDVSGVDFTSSSLDLTNYNDSVLFVVNQVWQKVGNIVNVNLRAEWLAYCPPTAGSNKNPGTLYHISDYMFGYNTNEYGYQLQDIRNNDQFKHWYTMTDDQSYNLQCTLTSRNKCLTKIISGLGSPAYVPNPFNNNVGWNNFYHTNGLYKNIYVNNDNNNLENQPISVFQIPFSITGCTVSSIYGNGNILTEGINGIYEHSTNDGVIMKTFDNEFQSNYYASGSVVKSTNVIVGERAIVSQTVNANNGYFGTAQSEPSNKGTEGTSHKRYGEYGTLTAIKEQTESTKSTYQRMIMPSNDYVWNEAKFIKTTILNDDITYFYPQMIVPWGNAEWYDSYKQSGRNIITPNNALRPVVGLYTTMSLNYSYVITPNLDDKFIGTSYRGFQVPDSNLTESFIQLPTHTSDEAVIIE